MAIPRLAGAMLGRFLKYGLGDDAAGVAMRVLPDVGFAALTSLTAPDDYARDPGERGALFLQDFLLGAAPGMLAGGAAGMAARRFGKSPSAARGIAGTADMIGSFTIPTAFYATGNAPVSKYLDERARKDAELQAELDRKGAFEQGLQSAASTLAQSPYIQGPDQLIDRIF